MHKLCIYNPCNLVWSIKILPLDVYVLVPTGLFQLDPLYIGLIYPINCFKFTAEKLAVQFYVLSLETFNFSGFVW